MELDNIGDAKVQTPGDVVDKEASSQERVSLERVPDSANTRDTAAPNTVEYLNVFRRSAIIVGVALALFTVSLN